MTKEMTQAEKETIARTGLAQAGLYDVLDSWGKDHLKNEYFEACVRLVILEAELEALRPTRIIMPS